MKLVIFGVLLVLGACLFWYQLAGNPLAELALIRRARIAPGSLIDTQEYGGEDDRGHVYLSDVGVYSYRLPDGREFKTTTRVPTGKLIEQREVEYLRDNPRVSRIKGDGCQSVTEWVCRKVVLGSLLLALFVSPGLVILRNGIREIKKSRTAAREDPRCG